MVGSTLDPDPAPDHIWLVLFDLNLGSTPEMALVTCMSQLTWLWWEGSTPDKDPDPDTYLGCTSWPEFSLYWYHVNQCYLQNSTFCPITPFQMVRFENTLYKWGCFFQMVSLSTKTLCYLENWKFSPIFLFISILFAPCLQKPYILLFKCNVGSLEWLFGTYSFM